MNTFLKNLGDIFRYTFTSVTTVLIFLVLMFILNIGFWWSLIISVVIGAFFFYKQNDNKNNTPHQKLRKVSSEKEAFYKANGMDKEEIHFFRETMYTAKLQILTLEKNMNAVSKLKAIEQRNNTINLVKYLFKEITAEPRRLHEVDKFLYVHLPSLTDLTNKYLEISQHEVKNKSTFTVLDQSATTIDEMCRLIAVDYVAFKSGDFDDMSLEVELAKKAIERDNGETNTIEDDEL
ncbi:MAG: 5-bromo-4-chloroindolyl phosphate hydrolysis family protein [Carnobacterium sp.]